MIASILSGTVTLVDELVKVHLWNVSWQKKELFGGSESVNKLQGVMEQADPNKGKHKAIPLLFM